MTAMARAAAAVTVLTLASTPRLDAQHHQVRFTLTGGPHAGSYEMDQAAMCQVADLSADELELSAIFDADRPKGWRDDPDRAYAKGFVLSTPRAKGGKAGSFALAAGFATPRERNRKVEYVILTIPRELQEPGLERDPEGRGDVTVERTDAGAKATFRGETQDGVRIEGSLECGR
jgi:hypothetical protein